MGILLWFLLLIICWPVAIILLILYPIIWLLSIPFRILGFAMDGFFQFIKAIFLLPSRLLGG
jgi:hypothetical protein